jgi:hypothetical protein
MGASETKALSGCHDRPPLSSPACGAGWWNGRKLLYINDVAVPRNAGRCSGFVGRVTAVSATAAGPAVKSSVFDNGGWPTVVTNRAQRGGWITGIDNGLIEAAVAPRPA